MHHAQAGEEGESQYSRVEMEVLHPLVVHGTMDKIPGRLDRAREPGGLGVEALPSGDESTGGGTTWIYLASNKGKRRRDQGCLQRCLSSEMGERNGGIDSKRTVERNGIMRGG